MENKRVKTSVKRKEHFFFRKGKVKKKEKYIDCKDWKGSEEMQNYIKGRMIVNFTDYIRYRYEVNFGCFEEKN